MSSQWHLSQWKTKYQNAAEDVRSLAVKPRSGGKLEEGNGGTGCTPTPAASEPPSSVDKFTIAFQRTLTANSHPGAMTQSFSQTQSFPSYSAWHSANFSGEIPPELLRESDDELEKVWRTVYFSSPKSI
jgi:hypothetical protein